MEKPKEQGGLIYFLLAERVDIVKIGWSRGRNINRRMKYLVSHSPLELDLLKVLPGSMRDEKQLHKRFGQLRIHGEWFAYTGELKAFIDKLK